MGVYHVSWIEQIWLLKSHIYMLLKDDNNFQRTTDMILDSRLKLFKEAEKETEEIIIFDRCTYNAYEIMAMESRRKNIVNAINFLKQAILIKGNIKVDNDNKNISSNPYKYYDNLMNFFNRLQEKPYDNIKYLYCASCRFLTVKGFAKDTELQPINLRHVACMRDKIKRQPPRKQYEAAALKQEQEQNRRRDCLFNYI
ncbi:hypothetical protein [Caloramator sp. Dgby_cultured_2]|uniref:hypothetical protein n=1 Tax=Caloramator sp. Dgby_cultured_2 TaxID=3029174 RepID=UPI00237EC1FB|nr:hypothetical protein [Caloramator sp. Dgby_cultured_2]WDU82343.1 hypothetical protein PWK10_11710 [Caloramator sp. Dgby_cultured_2]